MLEVRVLDGAGVRAHVEDVRRIHGACFPEDVDDEDAEGAGGHPDDAFWDRLTACHDADDVLWFLLVDAGDARAEDSDPGTPRSASSRDTYQPRTAVGEDDSETTTREGDDLERREKKVKVVGFAAATRYARCAYGMHLAVDPALRGRGHGAWLMREVQSWAVSVGYAQMQASVDAKNGRLIAYYQSLGAERVKGIGGGMSNQSAASAPTVVRIARRFDEALCARELRWSRERSRRHPYEESTKRGGNKRWRRFLLGAFFFFFWGRGSARPAGTEPPPRARGRGGFGGAVTKRRAT
jgi:ribosomal protein S18 acetylase RimI-like enzyme